MKLKMLTLAVISLAACAIFLTAFWGQTYARYDNTVSIRDVYIPGREIVTSNFLAEDGRTVYLTDWKDSSICRDTVIQISTETGGTLTCSTDSEWLTATIDDSAAEGGQWRLVLTRVDGLSEQTQAAVRVNWTPEGKEEPTMWAECVVNLFPQSNEADDSDATETTDASDLESSELVVTDLTMECAKSFSMQEFLPVILPLPQGVEYVTLSYNGADFPANTRYVVNDAAFALADEMEILIPVLDDQASLVILLDFSWVESKIDTFYLSAEAQCGGSMIDYSQQTVSAGGNALVLDADLDGIIWEKGADLQIQVTGDAEDEYTVSFSLSFLTRIENDLSYIPVETGVTHEQGSLTLSDHEGTLLAGTYRLTVEKLFNNVVVASYEIPIFLHD